MGRAAVLGLSTDKIGDISVEDLRDNLPALKMLLHKYNEYIDENKTLNTKINALQTELQIYVAYRDGYSKQKSNSHLSATLNLFGTVVVGFGVNFSTPEITSAGAILLLTGIVASSMAIILSIKN